MKYRHKLYLHKVIYGLVFRYSDYVFRYSVGYEHVESFIYMVTGTNVKLHHRVFPII